jgi:phage terminase large subunit-like protein
MLNTREIAQRAVARRNSPASDGVGFVPWREIARAKQLPPDGDWRIWLILAGRGFGKSRSINEWAIEQAYNQPGSYGALVAATASDVRNVVMEGPAGIMNISPPDFRPIYKPSVNTVEWPNGTKAFTYTADKPARLRGPQHHWAIVDELAAWRYADAWDQLMFGMRLGTDPRVAVATTPRAIPIIKSLVVDPTVVVVSGSTYENKDNLAKPFLDAIVRRYEGTTLGQQELYAKLLSDNPRALWKRDNLEALRLMKHPDLVRIVVGVDPQAKKDSRTRELEGGYDDISETGIVVAGIGADGQGYVLDDLTVNGSPDEWGRAAVTGYHKFSADRMAGEVNNGGDMVEHTVKVVDRTISFKQLHASRGKHTRAEPVAALYEQGRVHHVGMFAALEDQMCQWVPGDDSPDRMDALVWALTELMLGDDGRLEVEDAPDILANWRG